MASMVVMQKVDLSGIDLNLLTLLEALLETRNVTRAGDRLDLSQPAASRALQRLRNAFGDPLFVRTPGGLIPTPRVEELREPLERALAQRTGPPLEHRLDDADVGPEVVGHQRVRDIRFAADIFQTDLVRRQVAKQPLGRIQQLLARQLRTAAAPDLLN